MGQRNVNISQVDADAESLSFGMAILEFLRDLINKLLIVLMNLQKWSALMLSQSLNLSMRNNSNVLSQENISGFSEISSMVTALLANIYNATHRVNSTEVAPKKSGDHLFLQTIL